MGMIEKIETITQLGEDIVKYMKQNILKKRRVKSRSNGKFYTTRINSSGDLLKSVDYSIRGNTLQIEANDYAEEVDGGRRPGKGVPISSLKTWIKEKPVRLRKKGKFIKMNDKNITNFAGYVSYKIKKYGIEPTHFMSEAIEKGLEENEQAINNELTEELTIQIRNILIKLQK